MSINGTGNNNPTQPPVRDIRLMGRPPVAQQPAAQAPAAQAPAAQAPAAQAPAAQEPDVFARVEEIIPQNSLPGADRPDTQIIARFRAMMEAKLPPRNDG